MKPLTLPRIRAVCHRFTKYAVDLQEDEDLADLCADHDSIGTVRRLLYAFVVKSQDKDLFDAQKKEAVGLGVYEKLSDFFADLERVLTTGPRDWGVGGLGKGYYQQLTEKVDKAEVEDQGTWAQAERFSTAFLRTLWGYDTVIKLISSHNILHKADAEDLPDVDLDAKTLAKEHISGIILYFRPNIPIIHVYFASISHISYLTRLG